MSNDTTRRRSRPRPFGTVRRLSSGRYQARYVWAGERHAASTTFSTAADARRWLSLVQADLLRGEWSDPRLGRTTFAEWADEWLRSIVDTAPRTRDGYESLLRVHVLPFFGHREIARVEQVHVRRFVAEMTAKGAAAGTTRNAYRVASAVFAAAVSSGALRSNPAAEVKLPRADRAEMVFLTPALVEALARAITDPPNRPGTYPEYGLLVRFAAYTGLRAAEIHGLRAGRVDLLRGVVHVVETTVPVRGGGVLERQPTKNRQRRAVPIPRFLVDALAEHLGPRAADPDAFVFPAPDGGPLHHNTWSPKFFRPAVRAAGLPVRPRFHDLRHTYAAWLIAEGAHPRAIMERMGHSTINVTLDTYGHLLPEIDAALTTALDGVYRTAAGTPETTAEVRKIGGSAGG